MDSRELKKIQYRCSAKNYRKEEHQRSHRFLGMLEIYNRNPILALLGL